MNERTVKLTAEQWKALLYAAKVSSANYYGPQQHVVRGSLVDAYRQLDPE